MKIEREKLMQTLDVAFVGVTPKPTLEQSDCFVFDGEELVTFSGEILTRADNPLPEVRGAVLADDFRKVLHKLPDDVVEVYTKGGELRIEGKRKKAGIARSKEVTLPYADVPKAGEWSDLPPELMGTLLQAARVCGKDDSQPRTMEVHATPKLVEACDGYRFFRCALKTGFEKEVLIPASSIAAVGSLTFGKASVSGGWLHLRRRDKQKVSLRCSAGEYPEEVNRLLDMEDAQKIRLPGNLPEILSRAEVMQDSSTDALVSIKISAGKLTLRAKKDTGWYEENRDIKYSGDPLSFDVNPAFLEEVLSKSRTVKLSGKRMKIESEDTVFVVVLDVGEKGEKKDKHDSGEEE